MKDANMSSEITDFLTDEYWAARQALEVWGEIRSDYRHRREVLQEYDEKLLDLIFFYIRSYGFWRFIRHYQKRWSDERYRWADENGKLWPENED